MEPWKCREKLRKHYTVNSTFINNGVREFFVFVECHDFPFYALKYEYTEAKPSLHYFMPINFIYTMYYVNFNFKLHC